MTECKSKFAKNNAAFVCQWPDCACVKNGSKKYQNVVKGHREIGDIGSRYYRSLWEINFARYLEHMRQTGEPVPVLDGHVVSSWNYESETFWFDPARAAAVKRLYKRNLKGFKRGVTNYTPDFIIKAHPSGSSSSGDLFHEASLATVELIVEVKGFYDKKSMTKLRRMKQYYPENPVIEVGSQWFKMNEPSLSLIVPGWERKT